MVNGKDPFEPMHIREVTKSFNYFTNLHPKWEVKFIMNSQHFQTMFENQNNMYVAMSLKQIKYAGSNIQQKLTEEVLFDQIFIPFFYPNSFSQNFDKDVNSNGELADKNNPASAHTREMRMALYSYNGIICNKDQINAVLSNGTKGIDVGTAIKYIIAKSGFKDNECIIDKPTNDNLYEQIVLPIHNFLTSMKDLQARYGIYNSSLEVFFDEPILYILNKFNEDPHDYKENTTHTVIFETMKGNITPMAPSIIEELENKDQKYMLASAPKKINIDVYQSELKGDILSYMNYETTSKMLEYKTTDVPETSEFQKYEKPIINIVRDVDKHVKTGSKTLLEYDELSNENNITSFAKESTPHTFLSFPEINFIDYNSFKPNTEITLKFVDDNNKDLKQGGRYRIYSGQLVFTKISSDKPEFSNKLTDLTVIKI
jgi:hypothetical protein